MTSQAVTVEVMEKTQVEPTEVVSVELVPLSNLTFIIVLLTAVVIIGGFFLSLSFLCSLCGRADTDNQTFQTRSGDDKRISHAPVIFSGTMLIIILILSPVTCVHVYLMVLETSSRSPSALATFVGIVSHYCVAISAFVSGLYSCYLQITISGASNAVRKLFNTAASVSYLIGSLVIISMLFVVFPYTMNFGEIGFFSAAHACTLIVPVAGRRSGPLTLYSLWFFVTYLLSHWTFIGSQVSIYKTLMKHKSKLDDDLPISGISKLPGHMIPGPYGFIGQLETRERADEVYTYAFTIESMSDTIAGSKVKLGGNVITLPAAVSDDSMGIVVLIDKLKMRTIKLLLLKVASLAVSLSYLLLVANVDLSSFNQLLFVLNALTYVLTTLDLCVVYSFNSTMTRRFHDRFRRLLSCDKLHKSSSRVHPV